MAMSIEDICQQAKELPDIDKLALVDTLLAQLNPPDPELGRVWVEEARRRRQAYREGRLKARDYEHVIENFPHS